MYICHKVDIMDNSIFNIFDRCREKFPIFEMMEDGESYSLKRKDFYDGKLSFSANLGNSCITVNSKGHAFKMVLYMNDDTGHTFEVFGKDLVMSDDFCLQLLKMNIVLLNPEYDVVRILRMYNLNDILNED